MSLTPPSLTMGIEEEYLIVDRVTRDLADEPMADIFAASQAALGERVAHELQRAQIEVSTDICHSIADARRDLSHLRGTIARIAGEHGCAPIAASTHPFAHWQAQRHTELPRYDQIGEDLQYVARRMVTCGMHVHVCVEDPDLRLDLMNQVMYFLPHLLALSTSSPFWDGDATGLMSYRLSVMDEIPRSGLPEQFQSAAEFNRTVDVMVAAGLLEDATKLWWDIRPSARFPTIEMRMLDVCTRLEDGLALAAILVCLCRMLYRLRRDNQRWRVYSRTLINENRWLAQRYSTDRGLVDFGKGEVVPYAQLLEEMLSLIKEDAEHFGCTAEVTHARRILERGTSAHRQLAAFRTAEVEGKSREECLHAVVDGLIADTVADL